MSTASSYIELIENNITISNEKNSKTYNNTNHIEVQDFISINSSIFQGTSADSYAQIEQLNLLINKNEDEINRMLESQSIYAIGPYFQQSYSVLSIACWVTKPLNKSLIEKLSNLFDNMFEVVEIISDNIINNDINQDKVSSDNNHNLPNGTQDRNQNSQNIEENPNSNENSEENEKNENDEINRNSGENPNNRQRNGGNGNNSKNMNNNEETKAAEDKGNKRYQSFYINVLLSAKIKNEAILNFSIEFDQCGVGEMLNKKCQSLKGWFVGFYLESIIIEVSPITNSANDNSVVFVSKGTYSPRQIGPKDYEISKGRETNNNIMVNFSSPTIGASANYSLTNSNSIKTNTYEWEMTVIPCPIEGIKWSYYYKNVNFDKIDDHRMDPNLPPHSGKWIIKDGMKGFKISIKQILGCNIKPFCRIKKSKIKFLQIMKTCPQITHELEVSFNNVTNFNEEFANLVNNLKEDLRILNLNFEGNTNPLELEENSLYIARNITQKSTQSLPKNNKFFFI
ncbi:15982_t:CDS:2 [Gigaspora margarita]|uniref:15982_t:CDS:1 n=1 Tax=Gigaspora margarita TaxID=4874 RepID=A0ABM8W6Z9_GIGMA|nr:15982_t:CDS:2 [Gigaspora margarita]